MFYQHSNGSTTLPRGFRFHHEEERPKTPEPLLAQEPEQPSPPRPVRLRVKRRNVSNLHAPTEHFLASVAAADVPIPTIEIPRIDDMADDLEMPDREPLLINTTGFLAPRSHDAQLIPCPKTPVPMLCMEDGCPLRPDWSMGRSVTPEDYFQRPVSALSNDSDLSDESFYSGSRMSRPSEDGSCTSPESDITDPYCFPSISKGKGKAMDMDPAEPGATILNSGLHSKTRKDAPWTKAMSDHLWKTYCIYLQDATVTPFRFGASTVPPEGVCYRVAREAKRSWKGPKSPARRSTGLSSGVGASREASKSGSNTPTGEKPRTYVQWPHSSAATRTHLRELSRNSSYTTSVQRFRHLQSRSPTPFSKPYLPSRLRSPQPHTPFNTKDISLSLATSTAESMQPDGPLVKLASFDGPADDIVLSMNDPNGAEEYLDTRMETNITCQRLASPFVLRTYGPSSSRTLTSPERPFPLQTRSDTTTGPFLRSPLRFDRPRSLNNTQKRRAQHDLEEELSPNGGVLRPSILNEQLFGNVLNSNQRRVRSRGFSLGDDVLRGRTSGVFHDSPISIPSTSQNLESIIRPTLLPSATFEAPRLGSPFSESGPSNTFPRRLFQDQKSTVRRAAFATMHQTRRSIESFDFGEGPSLQSRLTHLDQKLAEIRTRETAAKNKILQ
ncbi:hypothetical protein B7494_g2460 [Chlorociboria aeruginascens]|nr:hypothetical protein B7494_g2460 [Chlorociboria aeruginascens]